MAKNDNLTKPIQSYQALRQALLDGCVEYLKKRKSKKGLGDFTGLWHGDQGRRRAQIIQKAVDNLNPDTTMDQEDLLSYAWALFHCSSSGLAQLVAKKMISGECSDRVLGYGHESLTNTLASVVFAPSVLQEFERHEFSATFASEDVYVKDFVHCRAAKACITGASDHYYEQLKDKIPQQRFAAKYVDLRNTLDGKKAEQEACMQKLSQSGVTVCV